MILNEFSKISSLYFEHPVRLFVGVIKDNIFKNTKEILSEK
jgi:hypothetical protein